MVKKITRGEIYRVLIEMPTINKQAYEEIYGLLKIGNEFLLQNGSKIIGKGQIVNVLYEQRE